MRGKLRVILMLFLLCSICGRAIADDTDIPPEIKAPVAVDETHPVYAGDSSWVAGLLIAIAGLFVAAFAVGKVVRAEASDLVPVAMSHKEDPAADRLGHASMP